MTDQDHRDDNLWVHPDYLQLLREHGLCDFDALMEAKGQANLHKKGLAWWRERIVLTLKTPEGDKQFYLKRYTHPPLKQQLNRLLRAYSSTAEIEWHWLCEVAELSIPTPLPIAYGARQRGPKEVQSLILMTEVPGQSLEKWLPLQLDRNHLDLEAKSRLIRALADLVRLLHRAKLVHRDLYLSHIFVNQDTNGELELFLIDLQRVIKPHWRRRRWIVKDLAALNYSTAAAASQTDRLRWLKRYLDRRKLVDDDRALIKAVVAKTERIRRHSQKHGLG